MKKILLTLGTTVVIAAPLATVVACGKSTTTETKKYEAKFDSTTKELTIEKMPYVNSSNFETGITETTIKTFLDTFYNTINVSSYKTATKLKLVKLDDEDTTTSITIADTKFNIGKNGTTLTATTLEELLALDWQGASNVAVAGKSITINAKENTTWQLFEKGITPADDAAIRTALGNLDIASTKTHLELDAEADLNSPATTEEEANSKFGIVKAQYDHITTALSSNWKVVSIDYDKAQKKFKLVYNNNNEINNKKEILLNTKALANQTTIIAALEALSLTSTVTAAAAESANNQRVDENGAIPLIGLNAAQVTEIKNAISTNGTTGATLDYVRYVSSESPGRLEVIFALSNGNGYTAKVPVTFA